MSEPRHWRNHGTRVLRRRAAFGLPVLQFAFEDEGVYHAASPLFDDLDQLKSFARSLLKACNKPILDEGDVETRDYRPTQKQRRKAAKDWSDSQKDPL